MTEIVFAIPLMPGKDDADIQMRNEMTGARQEEYAAALKDAGITRQAVWHQKAPGGGTLAIVYIEATDPEAHQRFVASDSDISQWFVQQMLEVHGRDVSEPPLPVELVQDFHV